MQVLTIISTPLRLLRRLFLHGGILHGARAHTFCLVGLKNLLRLVVVFVIVGVGMFSRASAEQIIVTYSSDGTFTVPEGVTEIIVEAWGGGGGGATGNGGRAGGGGGAYSRRIISVTPGASYVVIVGAGGIAGAIGGNSLFGGDLVTAPGGSAGSGETGGSGGAAGAGDVNFSGGRGANVATTGNIGGGGGSSAGTNANGNPAIDRVGGVAPSGGGDGGDISGSGNNADGLPGSVPGGGGAGKNGPGGGGVPAAGARGQVIVTYTLGQTYTLSGIVVDSNNDPLQGVTIQATGGFISTTAADGTFSINGVPAGTTGITLTPSLAQYTFTPEQITVAGPVNANVGDLNFTASLVSQTYSISGTITHGTNPLPGVTVTASGGHEQTVETNASGEYILLDIPHGTNLTITPSLTGYDFVPFSIEVNNLTENIDNQDFAAFSQDDRVISGTILQDPSGEPLEGVAVTANVNGVNQTFFTNQMGVYQVTGMGLDPQTITITPSLSGYSFSPAERTVEYNHNNPQVTGQDFLAIALSGSFYSRQSGNWNQPATWSRTGHSGTAASRAPEAGDQVFVSAAHTVSLIQNIIHNSTITVSNLGTLVTGPYIITGSGTFSLASNGVLQIGAAGGISQSGSTGNIQTAGRNFSSEAHYVYNGTLAQSTGNALPETIASLTIDNPSGVNAVSSHRVTAQLVLQNGTLTMPVGGSMAASQTVSSGGDLRMRTSFQGGKGWRMVTSPVQTTYSDMFSGGFVTQGFAGSGNPDGQPNLLYFDETDIGTTNQAWRTLSSLGQGTFGGKGYFYYVFAGDGGYSDNLPLEMSATGIEHAAGSGSFNFQATYTPRTAGIVDNTEVMELNAGWNLVGNPSSATIDWSFEDGWTKNEIATPIYIWGPGGGNYVTWNGITGSGTTKIAPFQAFWVLATGSTPVLQMNSGAKGLGGSFAQKGSSAQLSDLRINTPVLHIELHSDTLYAFAHLTFMPDGKFGEDPWDAYRLEPLSETFMKLYTTSSMHNKPLVINNMPDDLNESIQVPLYVGGQQEGIPVTGSYTLNWHNSGIWPEHWTVTLMDHQLEKAISMKRHDTYEFNVTGAGKSTVAGKNTAGVRSTGNNTAGGKSTAGSEVSSDKSREPQQFRLPQNIIATHDPAAGLDPVAKASTAKPRFTIGIKPYSTEEEEPEYIPNEARMMSPYPNPFDHHTTIRFSLPEAAHVTVEVFDIQGRRVTLLADHYFESGTTTLPWSPNRLPGGIYIAVMRTEGHVETQKISLIR